MNLNRSVRKFANIPLEGWDGTSWTPNVGKGILEVYSRFITERTFGVIKRILMCPEPIPSIYTVLKTPDGTRYLVAFLNRDITEEYVYNNVYLLQQVTQDAIIVSFSYTPSASGMQTSQTETRSSEVPCYLERYSVTSSTEADGVVYPKLRVLLPSGTQVDIDDEIEVGTDRYKVTETDEELNLTRAYVTQMT